MPCNTFVAQSKCWAKFSRHLRTTWISEECEHSCTAWVAVGGGIGQSGQRAVRRSSASRTAQEGQVLQEAQASWRSGEGRHSGFQACKAQEEQEARVSARQQEEVQETEIEEAEACRWQQTKEEAEGITGRSLVSADGVAISDGFLHQHDFRHLQVFPHFQILLLQPP